MHLLFERKQLNTTATMTTTKKSTEFENHSSCDAFVVFMIVKFMVFDILAAAGIHLPMSKLRARHRAGEAVFTFRFCLLCVCGTVGMCPPPSTNPQSINTQVLPVLFGFS